MPIAARTEGRERMPSETVSAIMTDEAWASYSREDQKSAAGSTHASLPVYVSAHNQKHRSRRTNHQAIVLYLTSEFDSSPNGSLFSSVDRESLLPIKAFPPSTSSFEASPVLELARSAMNSFSCSVTAIGKWIKHKKVRWEIDKIDRIIDNRKLSLRQRSGNHRWKGRKLMEAG